MYVSIQTKLVGMALTLVLLVILSLSIVYYALARTVQRQKSQERIQIAFDILLNDLNLRTQQAQQRIAAFVQRELGLIKIATAYQEKPEDLGSPAFVAMYLAKAAETLNNCNYLPCFGEMAPQASAWG